MRKRLLKQIFQEYAAQHMPSPSKLNLWPEIVSRRRYRQHPIKSNSWSRALVSIDMMISLAMLVLFNVSFGLLTLYFQGTGVKWGEAQSTDLNAGSRVWTSPMTATPQTSCLSGTAELRQLCVLNALYGWRLDLQQLQAANLYHYLDVRQEANGYLVVVRGVYVNANRVIIVYTFSGPGEVSQSMLEPIDIVLTDERGTPLRTKSAVGNGGGNLHAFEQWFEAPVAQEFPPLVNLRLTLTLGEVVIPSPDLSSSPYKLPVASPFVFTFVAPTTAKVAPQGIVDAGSGWGWETAIP